MEEEPRLTREEWEVLSRIEGDQTLYFGLAFSPLEMREARDFEGLVNTRLRWLKEQVMRKYRLHHSPFAELERDEP